MQLKYLVRTLRAGHGDSMKIGTPGKLNHRRDDSPAEVVGLSVSMIAAEDAAWAAQFGALGPSLLGRVGDLRRRRLS